MHLYWRVQQDLDCLGETIVFHDPRFLRNFRQWVKRNAEGLRLAENIDLQQHTKPSMN